MKSLGTLVPFDSATGLIAAASGLSSALKFFAIDKSSGRVLAQDVTATHSAPPFDRASMDGYAVMAVDLASVGPTRTLPVIEEVFAGRVPQKKLASGQATQIATGARLPEGADTVVMVEDTQRKGTLVEIQKYPTRGSNITLKGSDIREGETIIKAGTVLDPAKIGVLASQGLTDVSVYVKPVVAIMPTGEEIVDVGRSLREGQIYDINSHTHGVSRKAKRRRPRVLPITADIMSSLKASLEKALMPT